MRGWIGAGVVLAGVHSASLDAQQAAPASAHLAALPAAVPSSIALPIAEDRGHTCGGAGWWTLFWRRSRPWRKFQWLECELPSKGERIDADSIRLVVCVGRLWKERFA